MPRYASDPVHFFSLTDVIPVQTLKDSVPEVKQATDKESRNAENGGHRGSFTGRGSRGRGGFAARGFASAGLTRGGVPGRANGDGPSDGPKPSDS